MHPSTKRWWLLSVAVAAALTLSLPNAKHGELSNAEAVLQHHGDAHSTKWEPAGLPSSLPGRRPIARSRAELFAPRLRSPAVQPAHDEPAALTAPPLAYRFAGTVLYDGQLKAVLTVGDRVHEAATGEIVDQMYRVRAVTFDTVTLVYMPLQIVQHIVRPSDPWRAAMPAAPEDRGHSQQAQVGEEPSHLLRQASASAFPSGSPLAKH